MVNWNKKLILSETYLSSSVFLGIRSSDDNLFLLVFISEKILSDPDDVPFIQYTTYLGTL